VLLKKACFTVSSDKNWLDTKREPEPVLAGNQVIVPDFSLERAGLKVYVEIVGFWTEEYLLRKAEKLKQVNVEMIIIVNEALACEKLVTLEKRPQLHFIYYRDKISLAPILRYLQSAFEEVKVKEIKTATGLANQVYRINRSYAEFCQQIGVSVESAQPFSPLKCPKVTCPCPPV
jgi:predicted nuclease of restriction endonuclease-like RecB superfamily